MIKAYSLFKPFSGIIISLIVLSCSSERDKKHPIRLWYNQPASEWTEALPVGNGRLGAMVYGKTDREQIQLNEESLWAGSKINNNNPGALIHLDEIRHLLLIGQVTKALDLSNKYFLGTPPRIRSYQTLGDLFINFGDQSEVKNYRRELDLKTGIARTEYDQGGIKYTREVFSSAPDNLIVIYIKAENGRINAKLQLQREMDAVCKANDNKIIMQGQIVDKDVPECGPGGEHMKFASCLIAKPVDGSVVAEGNQLSVKDASSLIILFTAATDYNKDSLNFDRTIDPLGVCYRILEKVENKTYKKLSGTHIADHQNLFSRVTFNICHQEVDTIPTDLRLKQVTEGKNDPHLVELYFQYGRYLLMGSSRTPGVLPANLQGIWNNHLEAPWSSDFHTNINLQMNYWPADVCNLPETTEPLIRFFQELTEPGKITAKQMYGCDGWTLHHLTDPFGRTGLMDGINWGTFPMAGAWMSLHLWDHFCFINDTSYLRNQIWPVLKRSARFVLDFLIPDDKGQLVTAPSYSPENAYILPGTKTPMQLTYASTIDIQIARELLNACVIASEILKENPSFIDSLHTAMEKLPPTRIGKNGTIMEWIEDYEEVEPGHRHMSHLFGLHPGTQITPETPELFEAAAKTIERRLANGGGHTGWSRAWIINFYARLLDGEKAYTHLQALLGKSTLPNLLDTHPPFQIDGNFGGTAGIAEMLLQSHAGFLHILPALPASWKDGSVRGLKARGNYEVDIYWKDGKLQKLILKAFANQQCKIRYHSNEIELNTKRGKIYSFEAGLEYL
jgi:alpha-L-fucosidase 2